MNKFKVFGLMALVVGVAALFQNCSNLESPSDAQIASVLASNSNPDTQAPELLFQKGPSAVTSQTSATFEFDTNDDTAGTECSFNGGDFQNCESPITFNGLTAGNYVFDVRAFDPAGNVSDVYHHAWKVDLTAATVQITSTLPAYRNIATASIAFSGMNGVVSFECKLDSGAYAPCVSPVSLSGLSQDKHTFYVRGKAAGGAYSEPDMVSWVIDMSAPTATILMGPKGVVDIPVVAAQTATFTYSVADLGGSEVKSIVCKVGTITKSFCTSPVAFSGLTPGASYVFSIQVLDNAGNATTVSQGFRYNVPGTGGIDNGR